MNTGVRIHGDGAGDSAVECHRIRPREVKTGEKNNGSVRPACRRERRNHGSWEKVGCAGSDSSRRGNSDRPDSGTGRNLHRDRGIVPTEAVAASTPLNLTVLVPCGAAPKFVPVIVTEVPTAPPPGVNEVIVGGGKTVKVPLLVAVPPGVVTERVPVVAPDGTVVAI